MFRKNIKRRKVGLALGSGGTRGLTTIGILKVLKKHGIQIDYIAGSSVGAVVGGYYAISEDIEKLEQIVTTLNYTDVLNSLTDLGKSDGLIHGNRFLDKIKVYIGDQNIENLEIPFAAVATDKDTGCPVVLDKGSLAEAMRASSSMPIIFEPFNNSSVKLIDGGISQNVPVDTVREMGADIVIAVNLSENALSYEAKSRVSTMQHYIILMLKNLAERDCRDADIVISPQFKQINWLDNIKNRNLLITEGERAAEEKIQEILKALNRRHFSNRDK